MVHFEWQRMPVMKLKLCPDTNACHEESLEKQDHRETQAMTRRLERFKAQKFMCTGSIRAGIVRKFFLNFETEGRISRGCGTTTGPCGDSRQAAALCSAPPVPARPECLVIRRLVGHPGFISVAILKLLRNINVFNI